MPRIGVVISLSKNIPFSLSSRLAPENALRFEGSEDLIFFEGDETEQPITFEITE